MPKLINCECGYVVRGDDDEDLLRNADTHIRSHHPELVDKLSRDDLLAMSEES
jgi:predicted small metal-binding protein